MTADRLRPLPACHLSTDRLLVGPWRAPALIGGDDLEAFVCSLLTPAVCAPLPPSWQPGLQPSEAAEWLAERDAQGTFLIVLEQASRTPVGVVSMFDGIEDGERLLRVGYVLAEWVWGRGYATELLGGLIDWAREQPLAGLGAVVERENAASRRVLEKNGFVPWPEGAVHAELDGYWRALT